MRWSWPNLIVDIKDAIRYPITFVFKLGEGKIATYVWFTSTIEAMSALPLFGL